jgi:hypothetical protein
VNDDPAWFDNWLPEVGVGAPGNPYVMWYDWRDSPPSRCGGVSQVYFALSTTGGSSWSSLGPATTAASDWTNSSSYFAPNMGDYLGLYINDVSAYLAWADVRNGDPDVYTLTVSLHTTPALASLVNATAAPGHVTLTWYTPGGESQTANIYRRGVSGNWAPVAQLGVPSNGRIVYIDTHVSPGARYDYKIGLVSGGTESFPPNTQTTVIVPTLALAIAPVSNPAIHDLWVSLTLPNAAPATVRVIDVLGREVRRRDVTAAAGPQRVNLADGGQLPIGVYAIQLAQGGRSVSTRVSVLR